MLHIENVLSSYFMGTFIVLKPAEIQLFLCCSFNDAVNNKDYTV
jgi:hypothetical protein